MGLTNVKGITVRNKPSNGGYTVSFRAELVRDGQHYTTPFVDSSNEAATLANKLFKDYYGGKRQAQKAGYWNIEG